MPKHGSPGHQHIEQDDYSDGVLEEVQKWVEYYGVDPHEEYQTGEDTFELLTIPEMLDAAVDVALNAERKAHTATREHACETADILRHHAGGFHKLNKHGRDEHFGFCQDGWCIEASRALDNHRDHYRDFDLSHSDHEYERMEATYASEREARGRYKKCGRLPNIDAKRP